MGKTVVEVVRLSVVYGCRSDAQPVVVKTFAWSRSTHERFVGLGLDVRRKIGDEARSSGRVALLQSDDGVPTLDESTLAQAIIAKEVFVPDSGDRVDGAEKAAEEERV